jgi:hypothetical protein
MMSCELQPGQLIAFEAFGTPPVLMLVLSANPENDVRGFLLCAFNEKRRVMLLKPTLCGWSSGAFSLVFSPPKS